MTTVGATEQQRGWSRGYSLPTKVCRRCGAAFYTTTGLAVHTEQGCRQAVARAWRRRTKPHPRLVETGQSAVGRTNARTLRCDACGMESRPGPLTLHQRASGHSGWTELLS